jgi:hypothetical protein
VLEPMNCWYVFLLLSGFQVNNNNGEQFVKICHLFNVSALFAIPPALYSEIRVNMYVERIFC